MKILVVTPNFLPVVGGAEIGIYEIFSRLAERHEVRILVPEFPEETVAQSGADDSSFDLSKFEVVRFEDKKTKINLSQRKLIGRCFAPASMSFRENVMKQAREFGPDVVNFHHIVPTGFAIRALKRKTSTPVVLSLIGRSDVFNNENGHYRRHRKFFWKVAKSCDYLLPITAYTFGELKGAGYPYRVVNYGVDLDRFVKREGRRGLRKDLGISEDAKVVFTLQRLSAVKRVDLVIRAMKRIAEEEDGAVLVIGGKGSEEESLKKLAARMGIGDSVKLVGFIPEKRLPEFFEMSDVFAFSSSNETFGIVFAQAMAAGVPIAAPRMTAIPEVVADGENGILFDELDPGLIAEAVVRLLRDNDLRSRIAGNNRRKAEERFSWDKIAGEYEDVFKIVVER